MLTNNPWFLLCSWYRASLKYLVSKSPTRCSLFHFVYLFSLYMFRTRCVSIIRSSTAVQQRLSYTRDCANMVEGEQYTTSPSWTPCPDSTDTYHTHWHTLVAASTVFAYCSWWWTRTVSETCRAKINKQSETSCISLVIYLQDNPWLFVCRELYNPW